jgi:hypothetical protein
MITRDILELAAQAELSDVERARERLQSLNRQMESLRDVAAKTDMPLTEFQRNWARINREQQEAITIINRLEAEMVEATVVARNFTAATHQAQAGGVIIGQTFGKGGSAGMAMLQFSQLVDDAQYGMRGIVNNIGPLAMSLGRGAGLAGVVTTLAVAAYGVYENWDKIVSLWDGGATERETERMRKLTEETQRAKDAAQQQLDAIRKQPGQVAQDRAGVFNSLVDEFGGKTVEQALRQGRAVSTGMAKGGLTPFEAGKLNTDVESLMVKAQRGDADAVNALTQAMRQAPPNLIPPERRDAFLTDLQNADLGMGRADTSRELSIDAPSKEERLKKANDALVDMLNETGELNQRDSDAKWRADQAAERKQEQAAEERQRQAEIADRQLSQKARDIGGVMTPWAASQIAAREGTREQLIAGARSEGLNPRAAARFADQQMRGQGFLSDDQIRAQVSQGVMASGRAGSPEEVSQITNRIMGQANEQIRETFSQAEQAFATRDEAILTSMQRLAAEALSTAEKARQIGQRQNQGANGGRNFPPNMRRNGP